MAMNDICMCNAYKQNNFIISNMSTLSKEQLELPTIRRLSLKEQLTSKSSYKEEEPDYLNELLRRKISSYVNFRPMAKSPRKTNKKPFESKKNPLGIYTQKNFPQITDLSSLVNQQKQILYVYRQRMEINCEQCFLFFLQVLQAAIKHQIRITEQKNSRDESVLIQSFLFVAESLLQIGHEKLAFFFCAKTIKLCEIFGNNLNLGYSLYLVGIICRKLSRFNESIVFLKKALEYMWIDKKKISQDYEIQVYNQLSYNFLQINLFDQSKIFAFKYEIGYLEGEDSNIIDLSHELVLSIQKRRTTWHSLTEQSMELLLSFNLQLELKVRRSEYSGKIDQNKIMNVLKISFDIEFENLLKNDIFFYEIALPLEIKQNINPMNKTRRVSKSQKRFISQKKSSSVGNFKILKQKQKAKEQIIFNYRGISFSKHKLSSKFTTLVNKIREKLNIPKR